MIRPFDLEAAVVIVLIWIMMGWFMWVYGVPELG